MRTGDWLQLPETGDPDETPHPHEFWAMVGWLIFTALVLISVAGGSPL